jgi:hypothetical protein
MLLQMQLVRIFAHHEDPKAAADLFASEEVAAIGWSSLGDLEGKTREEIKGSMKKRWKLSEQGSARRTSELLTLRDKVKTGDVVFAYVGDNTVALVGEVVGGYSFNDQNKVGDKKGPVGYAHQIRVKWRDAPRNFSRFSLPKDLSEWVKGRGTIGTLDYDGSTLKQALARVARKSNVDQTMGDQSTGRGGKRGPPWSRGDDVLVLALYRATGPSHDDEDPEIEELARVLNRSAASVVLKIGNFKAIATKGQAGLSHFTPLDLRIWNEFEGREKELFEEASKIRSEFYSQSKEREASTIESLAKRLAADGQVATAKLSQILARQKTEALREAVLMNYQNKCAFCDLDIPELLVAAHIHRWTDDEKNRFNLSNVICLCVLHHRAFDNGFLAVSSDGLILISPQLKKSLSRTSRSQLIDLGGNAMRMPESFAPSKDFLADHHMKVFRHA